MAKVRVEYKCGHTGYEKLLSSGASEEKAKGYFSTRLCSYCFLAERKEEMKRYHKELEKKKASEKLKHFTENQANGYPKLQEAESFQLEQAEAFRHRIRQTLQTLRFSTDTNDAAKANRLFKETEVRVWTRLRLTSKEKNWTWQKAWDHIYETLPEIKEQRYLVAQERNRARELPVLKGDDEQQLRDAEVFRDDHYNKIDALIDSTVAEERLAAMQLLLETRLATWTHLRIACEKERKTLLQAWMSVLRRRWGEETKTSAIAEKNPEFLATFDDILIDPTKRSALLAAARKLFSSGKGSKYILELKAQATVECWLSPKQCEQMQKCLSATREQNGEIVVIFEGEEQFIWCGYMTFSKNKLKMHDDRPWLKKTFRVAMPEILRAYHKYIPPKLPIPEEVPILPELQDSSPLQTTSPQLELKTELLSHQKNALEKISHLKAAALFMEMGTGKSRTLIELAVQRLSQGKVKHVIWFCPVSTKFNAILELEKHLAVPPSVCLFNEKTRIANLPSATWYIVGIESLSSSPRVLEAVESLLPEAFVAIDESDLIKNHVAKRTKRLLRMAETAPYRLIMTGTPISNGIEDLFAQCYFLHWKILGYQTWRRFENNHLEYTDEQPRRIMKRHNEAFIEAKIAPYIYQVKREECLSLPEKLYHTRAFSMTQAQRDLYEQAKREILLDPDAFTMQDMTIFRLITALQRIASDGLFFSREHGKTFSLFDNPEDNPRVQLFLELVKSIQAEKVVIWTRFRRENDAIVRALQNAFPTDSVALLDGTVSEKERYNTIKKFQTKARFLVSNQSIGGRGIDLTIAHQCIYYSTTWKVAQRLQSEDRLHRLGQKREVQYFDIICSDSIDERIRRSQIRRINMIDWFKERLEKVKRSLSEKDAQKVLEELIDDI